jgi:uncharacterized protein
MLTKVVGWFRWILIRILMVPVYFYKYVISPMTPASCRHIPSCSEYAIEALKTHGPVKGIYLGTRRILKCHPWGTHGYDPVPPQKNEFKNKK